MGTLVQSIILLFIFITTNLIASNNGVKYSMPLSCKALFLKVSNDKELKYLLKDSIPNESELPGLPGTYRTYIDEIANSSKSEKQKQESDKDTTNLISENTPLLSTKDFTKLPVDLINLEYFESLRKIKIPLALLEISRTNTSVPITTDIGIKFNGNIELLILLLGNINESSSPALVLKNLELVKPILKDIDGLLIKLKSRFVNDYKMISEELLRDINSVEKKILSSQRNTSPYSLKVSSNTIEQLKTLELKEETKQFLDDNSNSNSIYRREYEREGYLLAYYIRDLKRNGPNLSFYDFLSQLKFIETNITILKSTFYLSKNESIEEELNSLSSNLNRVRDQLLNDAISSIKKESNESRTESIISNAIDNKSTRELLESLKEFNDEFPIESFTQNLDYVLKSDTRELSSSDFKEISEISRVLLNRLNSYKSEEKTEDIIKDIGNILNSIDKQLRIAQNIRISEVNNKVRLYFSELNNIKNKLEEIKDKYNLFFEFGNNLSTNDFNYLKSISEIQINTLLSEALLVGFQFNDKNFNDNLFALSIGDLSQKRIDEINQNLNFIEKSFKLEDPINLQNFQDGKNQFLASISGLKKNLEANGFDLQKSEYFKSLLKYEIGSSLSLKLKEFDISLDLKRLLSSIEVNRTLFYRTFSNINKKIIGSIGELNFVGDKTTFSEVFRTLKELETNLTLLDSLVSTFLSKEESKKFSFEINVAKNYISTFRENFILKLLESKKSVETRETEVEIKVSNKASNKLQKDFENSIYEFFDLVKDSIVKQNFAKSELDSAVTKNIVETNNDFAVLLRDVLLLAKDDISRLPTNDKLEELKFKLSKLLEVARSFSESDLSSVNQFYEINFDRETKSKSSIITLREEFKEINETLEVAGKDLNESFRAITIISPNVNLTTIVNEAIKSYIAYRVSLEDFDSSNSESFKLIYLSRLKNLYSQLSARRDSFFEKIEDPNREVFGLENLISTEKEVSQTNVSVENSSKSSKRIIDDLIAKENEILSMVKKLPKSSDLYSLKMSELDSIRKQLDSNRDEFDNIELKTEDKFVVESKRLIQMEKALDLKNLSLKEEQEYQKQIQIVLTAMSRLTEVREALVQLSKFEMELKSNLYSKFLNSDKATVEDRTFDVIVGGAGVNSIPLTAGLNETNPSLKTVTIELRNRVASTFTLESGAFRTNSGDGISDLSRVPKPRRGENLNQIFGALIQTSAFNSARYPVAKALAQTAIINRATLESNPILFNEKIEKVYELDNSPLFQSERANAKYLIVLRSGAKLYTDVFVGSEFKIERLAEHIKSSSDKDSLIAARENDVPFYQNFFSFLDNIERSTKPLTPYNGKTILIEGGGDSGKVTIEYIARSLENEAYAKDFAQNGYFKKIYWIVKDSQINDCETFLNSVRSRYAGISGLINSDRIQIINETVMSSSITRDSSNKEMVKLEFAIESDILVDKIISAIGFEDASRGVFGDLINYIPKNERINDTENIESMTPNGKFLDDVIVNNMVVGRALRKDQNAEREAISLAPLSLNKGIYFFGPAAGRLLPKNFDAKVVENSVAIFNNSSGALELGKAIGKSFGPSERKTIEWSRLTENEKEASSDESIFVLKGIYRDNLEPQMDKILESALSSVIKQFNIESSSNNEFTIRIDNKTVLEGAELIIVKVDGLKLWMESALTTESIQRVLWKYFKNGVESINVKYEIFPASSNKLPEVKINVNRLESQEQEISDFVEKSLNILEATSTQPITKLKKDVPKKYKVITDTDDFNIIPEDVIPKK